MKLSGKENVGLFTHTHLSAQCAHAQQEQCVSVGILQQSYHLPVQLAAEGHARRTA